MFESVIQEEVSGCGIASVANVVGQTYDQTKQVANGLGIYAEDPSLWSDTQYVRRLLCECGVQTAPDETPFVSWESLPDLALLSIKHYWEGNREFWHWVVFRRSGGDAAVLDSASYLASNVRTDFDQMKPEWYIKVIQD